MPRQQQMTFFAGNIVRFTDQARRELKVKENLPLIVHSVYAVPTKVGEGAESENLQFGRPLPKEVGDVTQKDIGHHQLVRVVGHEGLFSGKALCLG